MPSGIYQRTKEHNAKISAEKKKKPIRYWLGKKRPEIAEIKKGKKLSEETKKKIGEKSKGRKAWNKGKKFAKISGEKHWNWKGGITEINHKIRTSLEYKLWRKSVFERDNYTCIWCGKVGGKLNVDHIKPFCDYPELRFAIDNGRTLCIECHKKTGTWGCRTSKNICYYNEN